MKNAASLTATTANQQASKTVHAIKVSLFVLIAILVFILKGSCADSTHITAKTSVYVQLAGQGNLRSINVERVFSQGNKMNYSYSIGYAPANKSVSVPISLSAFTTGRQHHFEMSLALIPHVEKHIYSKTKEDLDKQLYIKPTVGYRYQKATGGLFVKAAVGPQIFMDPPSYNVWAFTPKLIAPSAQLAIGFSF